MDEAQDLVPALGSTPCSESTRRLASQARKYGLGLLFATQSPKSLHNSIPGNATTQLFGLLNAPAQIDAARELARAKGGDVPAISRLSAGEFYLATEGTAIRRIRTPMCLSHHPASPLTEDEVLTRAARLCRRLTVSHARSSFVEVIVCFCYLLISFVKAASGVRVKSLGRAALRPSKHARLPQLCANLINVRFSDHAGSACCHDSVESQTTSWASSRH
jgi:hypothetical protein